METTSRRDATHMARPARLALGSAAVFALSVLVWLTVLAVGVPALLGWKAVVVTSGSMRPAIRPGDVVLAEPARGAALPPGTVAVFHDPAGPGLVTHRVAEANPDGSYRTRGDANPADDSTPVLAAQVVGSARLLVPGVGLLWILTWQRDWPALAGLVVLVAAGLWAARYGLRPGSRRGAGAAASSRRGRSGRRRLPAALAAALVAAALVAPVRPAPARFIGATANGTNSFSASWCTTPGTQTLVAVADTTVDENNPTANFGTQADLVVRADTAKNTRVLVRFALPAASGCTVTAATLRLNTSTSKQGLTYLAYRAAAAWSEAGVTWNTQPSVTGAPASAATVSTNSWIAFDVAQLVRDAYAGTDAGFVIRDQVEDTGATNQNKYVSREGSATRRPELVVTYG